ncbi:site-specific tyrosine recombinase XerD [Streptococcus ictaluri]|uniref:Tyrosine recombinase XerD-like n=1 Tax=Streptococcus ictaluri 707-05 TaxID=764299 RepID=G5K1F1_9STRE|nr:site-specific tyrosine recombinase XerD [Streptococcus ictaluri]EHI70003.1 site-specific tyrosine recombinase XerD-like protein [Streptococcus ictaluri 707-05]
MISVIETFIKSKPLSDNSQKSYRYDLQQFCEEVGERITPEKLALYKQGLSKLSLSAKKRKISTVNQFLYFLYRQKLMEDFLKIEEKVRLAPAKTPRELIQREVFYQESSFPKGQLIALLILELGLIPSEIAQIRLADLDLEFKILKLENDHCRRVLSLSSELLPFLTQEIVSQRVYLFDHNGKPFSRQWFFKQLKSFLESIGQGQLTAQSLREQFIIKEKSKGKSMMAISQSLGLKSPQTIEKYFRT